MSTQDDEFLRELLATFKVEAEEHLQAMAAGLLELERAPAPEAQRRLVETVFRAAHSLKGAARAVDFTDIESLCQSLEEVFAAWKRNERTPSLTALDTLHRALDAVTGALAAPESPGGARVQSDWSSLRQSLRQLGTAASPSPAREPVQVEAVPAVLALAEALPPPAPAAAEKALAEETVRIAVAKLDARLWEAEEMLIAKLTAGQRAADLRELAGRFAAWRKAWVRVEPEVRALRQTHDRPAAGRTDPRLAAGLTRLVEFFDWSLDHLTTIENRVATLGRTAQQDRQVIGKLVDDLLDDSKKLLLLPFASLSASFPKLLRDLCRDLGKEVDLVIRGEKVEIDKRILEEMKDPLIHLLRNCIDHGVETPEQRTRLGKPPRATVNVAVSQVNGNKVEILVSDDGAGIDAEKVKESAVKHGFLSAAEAGQLGDAAARTLIFQSAVSTSPIITRLSGRGLGLAIVREKAEKLDGRVSVESQPGLGTVIRIVLPAMRATFRGILVEVAERLFIVPTVQVERVARVKPEDVQTVEGRETISLGGRAIALVQLAEVLELPPAEGDGELPPTTIIVLGTGDQRIAFAVNAVLDEQEVLVKPLHKPLSRVRNLAGATVLGSGQVTPVLNVIDLLKSARRAGGAPARVAARAKPAQAEAKSLLVAEDSITSRMLVKSILESAGYKVKTAVDGMEALTLLRAEHFDLVVSDVEMPRLNGFELTVRIRADKKLAELPVVLVTALESREDRERGIDVGANAYIVKSSFDRSDLLETVRRLV
jgi:two-component system, chemotaxis family, sensor kinase CheA